MLAVVRLLSTALPFFILLRLVQLRLLRQSPYTGFAVFLLVGLLRDLVLLIPKYETMSYSVVWEATLPLLLMAQVAAGLATYAAISKLYPGIGRFATYLFAACLLAAGVVGLAILPFEIRRIGAMEADLRVSFLVQRWVASVLAGGLVLALVYLSRFPSPARKIPGNVILHTACIATYFASYAVLYTIENLFPLGVASWAVIAQMTVICGTYCAWLGLSAKGEISEPWPGLDPAVSGMIEQRYKAAKQLMSQAAGEGGRK